MEEIAQKTILKRPPRTSVSAEVYGVFHKKRPYEPRVVPKTEAEKQGIKKTIIKSILFDSLEKEELETVINALENNKSKFNFKQRRRLRH